MLLQIPLLLTFVFLGTDQARIQGVWALTSYENATTRVSGPPAETIKIAFVGNQYLFVQPNGPVVGTFTCDATTTPRKLDLIPSLGMRSFAVYELEGDVLRISSDAAGKDRPKVMPTKPEHTQVLTVYKRIKP